ncbi:MAG: transposase [Alphaproteobacteria bacterium]|nr:transposase [Alphaproteobacteria bacterium]
MTAVFPEASVQTCIVHMIMGSLRYVGWKEAQAGGCRSQVHLRSLK